MKESIIRATDRLEAELIDLASRIFEFRELGFKEYHSAEALAAFLEEKGFEVTRKTADMETAFKAEYGKGKPNIALLCEYDALPEIGHACGHNQIAAISAGAAAALLEAGVLQERSGTLTVVGCPAEEIAPVKRDMVRAGVFKGVDAALIIHPASMSTGFDISYAIRMYQLEFFGKSAHAAADPEAGINALDAMILFFSGIGLLRQQLPERVRLHGIITNGGQSFNTIPEYTAAELGIRALELDQVKELTPKIERLAKSAAEMTGCTYKMTLKDELPDLLVNVPLAECLDENFHLAEEETVRRTYEQGVGSTDVGAVTYAIPGIQGYVDITEGRNIPAHTREFAEAANSEAGYQAMLRAVKALAMTCLDLYTDQELLARAKKYFAEKRRDF